MVVISRKVMSSKSFVNVRLHCVAKKQNNKTNISTRHARSKTVAKEQSAA
jgi:hypothetical protein